MSLKNSLFFTAIAALLIRLFYGVDFLSGEVAAFNSLPGLDMETLLRFSEWNSKAPESQPMFVLHRFLLFFCYTAAGKVHSTILIYVVQSLFGAVAAVFAAWGVYLLSKNSKAALAGGVIYAAYGPFLLYESVALQEAVLVHTLTIAFVLLLYFRQSQQLTPAIICGILLGLNSAGRPASAFLSPVLALIPVWEMRKQHAGIKPFAILICLLAVWGSAAIFNGYFRANFSPFFNVMPHLAEVHGATQSGVQNSSAVHPYFSVLCGAVKNVPTLFGMREIPENLDYDVLRQVLRGLAVGPILLMPFAVAGMITFILLKRKEMTILYISVAALVLPLASRVPIGRYRLMLVPFFIFFAVLLVLEMFENSSRRLAMAAIVTGVVGCNLLCAYPLVRPNPAAHHTLALAAMKSRKGNVEQHLQNAWEISGHTYKPSGLLLVLNCMKKQDFSAAEKVILQDKSGEDEFRYYLALIKISRNDFAGASAALSSIKNPQNLGSLYPKYLKITEFIKLKK